jgi:hypothetical protein
MIRRTHLTTLAVIAGGALGGAAIASAANSGTTSTTTNPPSTNANPPSAPMMQGYGAPAGHRDPSQGGHQANGKSETLLTGDTASKVRAAALAKVPGGTIERVETDADTGSPYEAHIRKSDGSEVIVYVDSSFNVTGTGTMSHP